jgi:hypothetical protein
MQTLATRFAITASIAALICATPVSVDLVRAGAAGPDGAARLALALDSAQAHVQPMEAARLRHVGRQVATKHRTRTASGPPAASGRPATAAAASPATAAKPAMSGPTTSRPMTSRPTACG